MAVSPTQRSDSPTRHADVLRRCVRRPGLDSAGAQSLMLKSAEPEARRGSCGWKSTVYTRSV
jgi:hypothetical protein